jgi:hypothetical protein
LITNAARNLALVQDTLTRAFKERRFESLAVASRPLQAIAVVYLAGWESPRAKSKKKEFTF